MKTNTLKDKVSGFLNCRTIAVIGISTTDEMEPANTNFKKLKGAGYKVIPVTPKTKEYDEQPCYPDIHAIEGGVEAALVFTPPVVTEQVVQQCYNAGIKNIWVHRSFGKGSCSESAATFIKDKKGVNYIDGACPMMFVEPVDFPHKCFKTILKWTKRLPN